MTMRITVDGCGLSFSVTGPEQAPALLLLNALGTTTHLWDAQIAPLSRMLRVIRCDTRGHGDADAPAGDYTLDRLGQDALAVLDAAGVRRRRASAKASAERSPAPAWWSSRRPTSRTWSNPRRSTRQSSSS